MEFSIHCLDSACSVRAYLLAMASVQQLDCLILLRVLTVEFPAFRSTGVR